MDRSRGRLASPGKRLAAHFLDAAIPLLALVVSCGVGGTAAAAGGTGSSAGTGIFLAFVIMVGYGVWAFKLFAHGVTPGKKALGMRVIRQDGSSAGLGAMIAREWVGKMISAMVFGLGFLWILFDRDRQGWHDKLQDTFVVE